MKAIAQERFPSKTVRIVVPFVAVSQVDIGARGIGLQLQDTWGQPVNVDTSRVRSIHWQRDHAPGRESQKRGHPLVRKRRAA